MNDSALNILRMIQDGTGDPLSPENIGATKPAFPVMLESISTILVSDSGLCATGMFPCGQIVMTWVNKDGTAGWQGMGHSVYGGAIGSGRQSALARFWREACWRLSRAWDALCGRESF